MDDPSYYRLIKDQLQATLDTDFREPKEWSDGDKLRLLAALFDEADFIYGREGHEVQDDLRRMAERLDIADLP